MRLEILKIATFAVAMMFGSAFGAAAQSTCPDNALSLQGATTCSCALGGTSTAVWGSGPYTADSNICTAARHAGAIGPNGGMIQVVMAPGQSSYPGSAANGVNTSTWAEYSSSYYVYLAQASSIEACGRMPTGQDVYVCSCAAGAPAGTAWGSGPYTDDSNICAAATHAGIISSSGGNVRVLAVPGLQSYRGSAWNGITTSDYGTWGRSITFDRN
jgi:LCCL domain-containing protein